MKINKFRIYRALIAAGLAIAVGIAITTDTPVIALGAVVAAIILAFSLELRKKGTVRDERISQISKNASSAAFSIMIILAAAASLGIALFGKQLPENVVFLGSIMGYFVCAAVFLNLCFYAYYSRKM
jgi:uncharacterized membrane protein